MDKSRIFPAIFLVLVLIRASDASTRILLADDKPTTEKVSPSPAPNSSVVNKGSKQDQLPKPLASPPDSSKAPEKKTGEPLIPKIDPKKDEGPTGKANSEEKGGTKDDKTKAGDDSSKGAEKKDDGPKGGDGPPKSQEKSSKEKSGKEKTQFEMCDGLEKCYKNDLVACLQHSEIDSKELVIIVQNAGDNTLDVNIAVPASVVTDAKTLSLDKHITKKVNISLGSTNNLTIVLNAGKEECTFQIGMVPSVTDWIQQFPTYAKQLPPMYGAYFLFFALFIAGLVWGCCKFKNRERRAVDGVAYQQLEMAAQTQATTETEASSTVDGWEQSWDDDWDEEATVRPSATSPNGHVSSNGLSSRSANKKNDWDIDWDD